MAHDLSHQAILGTISENLSPSSAIAGDFQIIDVRSPAEFADGSLPGAVNVPLFDDDERALVGTIYRCGGHNQAVSKGYDLVEGKLNELLAAFSPYRHRSLAIICARGGMRSRSIVNLLNQSGYRASQISGGYKVYRQEVMAALAEFSPPLIVVHGLTGTGKTRIIERLDEAIDLERFASHRSSLFGGIDRIPATQRQFESRLAHHIASLGEPPYFIEGESRKIGEVFIPKPLALAMKAGILVRVDCSLATRIRRIIADYPVSDREVMAKMEEIILSLSRNLGQERVAEMCTMLRIGDLEPLVHALLVHYYDVRYGKVMHNYRYSLEISSEDIETAVQRLSSFRLELVNGSPRGERSSGSHQS
jgi:tRNA 2-selenouridine synthase